ncbi:MAG TPA: NADPH-dependent FMN reductase [Steroidobacteraceae bacterium]|jgi:chromate reductase|nr:NADPH-dependent FMN reductase [Steroidobacteraceae bacterium]
MAKILGIAGSLRRASFNAALLRAAVQLAPAGTTIEIASIRGIPLYDADVEEQGLPAAVVELKEKIVAADALLLVTPEYNNSIPGVFKNVIDWLSRPSADAARVFANRHVTLIGASPGRFGTVQSQRSWLPVLRTLRMRPYFGIPLYVSGAADVFDGDGRLIDAGVRTSLEQLLKHFVQVIG